MPAQRSAVVAVLTAGVATCVLNGCVVKAPPSPAPSRVEEGQSLVDEGCYLCLMDAERFFAHVAAHDTAARRHADEAAVLIALRERELGLADTGHLKALDSRRTELSSDVQLLADVASVMPWSRRFAVDEDTALRRTAIASRVGWLPALEQLASTSLAADYVRLSLVCSYPTGGEGPPASVHYASPLIRFRLATCQSRDAVALLTLVGHVPRFVEARYLLGLGALIDGRVDEAEREVAEALAALPRWPAAANTLASIAFSVEDFETALTRYDDALTVDPSHRDALLGRIKALSYLDRHADAMASADEMLALGEYYVGDAHYWRAWNLYRLGRYEEAEGAVGLAKQYMRGPDASALAGHVAVARSKFEQARAEFTAALADAPGECDVQYALGGVELQFRTWTAAAGRFERALNCYEGREREVTEAVAKLPPTDGRRRASRARG